MKLLRIALFLVFSTAAFGQYMNYWSWVYVDPSTGLVQGGAETEFQDPYGSNPDDYVNATLGMNATSASGQSVDDWYEDNVGLGDAYDYFQLQVNALGNSYNVNSYHEVSGDMEFPCEVEYGNCFDGYSYGQGTYQYIEQSGSSSAARYIPPAPTITPNMVVQGGDLTTISYEVSSPVLDDALMVVNGQAATVSQNLANTPNFAFYQSLLPSGQSTFVFYGYMYGITLVPSNQATVIRTDGESDASGGAILVVGQFPPPMQFLPMVQNYNFDAQEFWSMFQYSIYAEGTNLIGSSGHAQITTDLNDNGGIVSILAGTNTVYDLYGRTVEDPQMVPPGPGFSVPQTDQYKSLVDGPAWYGGWLQTPGAYFSICVRMIGEADVQGSISNDFGCLGRAMPYIPPFTQL